MKKPVYVRIIFFLLLYMAVFTLIVMFQFPKQGLFTQHIGNLIITGQHRLPDDAGPVPVNGTTLLTGKASVIFGGMEFCLGPGAEGSVLRFINEEGIVNEVLPETLSVSIDTAVFRFPGGGELIFTVYSGRSTELRISCNFFGNYYALELPFRPLRRTEIGSSGNGGLSINSDGINYSFGPNPPDTARFVLLFQDGDPALSYRAMQEREIISLDDYLLAEAQNRQSYYTVLDGWLDRNFIIWGRMAREQDDENIVVAFASESINRENYGQAISAISPAFLNGNRRTHDSSVYLGQLDQASTSLRNSSLQKMDRLSAIINENSADFLFEERIYEYLSLYGNDALINNSVEIVRTIDAEELSLDMLPGILEAYTGWKNYRPYLENPFERFIESIEEVITDVLWLKNPVSGAGFSRQIQDGARVFVMAENHVDIEFNLRLGKALLVWAEDNGEDSWAVLARSLILSALLQAEEVQKTGFFVTEDDLIVENLESSDMATAILYRILAPNTNFPKILTIRNGSDPVWAWTTVPALRLAEDEDALDIAVNFFVGETHYMIIQGIPEFERLQLYEIDFPTDPQFERYNSSGWAYSGTDQTLMVKMRHRNTTEHIRIYF